MSGLVIPATAHWAIRDGYAYWQNARPGPGLLPGRQHIDPLDIPALLPFIWLFDVADQPAGLLPFNLRYRLLGSHVELGLGLNRTGRWVDAVEPRFVIDPELHAAHLAAVTRGEAHYRRGTPRFAHNKAVAGLERVLMPLARDGRKPDMLLGFTVFLDTDGAPVRTTL